jgi:hypothetical protein
MSFSGSGELKKDEGTTKERNSFSAHIVARASISGGLKKHKKTFNW